MPLVERLIPQEAAGRKAANGQEAADDWSVRAGQEPPLSAGETFSAWAAMPCFAAAAGCLVALISTVIKRMNERGRQCNLRVPPLKVVVSCTL